VTVKPLTEFSPDKRAVDGRCSHCRACHRVYNKTEKKKATDKAYGEKHRESISRRRRAYAARNADRLKAAKKVYQARNKEKIATYKAKWAGRNKEQIEARQREWRRANPEKHTTYVRRWAAANPERVRTIKRNRHARERRAEGTHTVGDIFRMYSGQQGLCKYCWVALSNGYHVDHIRALAAGGSNGPENLQLLCQPCNSKKSFLPESVFLRRHFGEALGRG